MILRSIEETKGIKTSGVNINNIRFADDTVFLVEREEELKILLM